MYGISSSGKEAIGTAVEKMFDSVAYQLLGNIPKLRDKSPFFGSNPSNSLGRMFIQALGGKEPNHIERDVLRSILNNSHSYIESLKSRTSARVSESVDALVREARIKEVAVTADQVAAVVATEMDKARNEMKVIAEAEATKTRNMGYAMEIVTKAQATGLEDPNVFFVIVRDSATCKECLRLHMLPDGITPRVWKMSELSMGYHKRGEDRPSACGEHPHCRCSLTQLAPGWGFKGGYVSFVGQGYDEYATQRG